MVLNPEEFRVFRSGVGKGQFDAQGIATGNEVAQDVGTCIPWVVHIQVAVRLGHVWQSGRDRKGLVIGLPAHALAVPRVPGIYGSSGQAHVAPCISMCDEVFTRGIVASSARMEVVAPIERMAQFMPHDVDGDAVVGMVYGIRVGLMAQQRPRARGNEEAGVPRARSKDEHHMVIHASNFHSWGLRLRRAGVGRIGFPHVEVAYAREVVGRCKGRTPHLVHLRDHGGCRCGAHLEDVSAIIFRRYEVIGQHGEVTRGGILEVTCQ